MLNISDLQLNPILYHIRESLLNGAKETIVSNPHIINKRKGTIYRAPTTINKITLQPVGVMTRGRSNPPG